jgi:L-fuconolactonase
MIVDAHHHLWDPASRPHAWLDGIPELRRRFGLDDFARVSAPLDVTASVLVQVLADIGETREFLALAATGNVVAAVVGWADLTRPDIASQLARLRALPGGDHLAGIRHLVQDEPDPAWLDRPDVRCGLRAVGSAGLVYDLLVRPGQLPATLRVTGDLDEVVFVLDHGAKPDIASGQLEPWATQIAELARRPNVSCKLSGLVTEAGPGWQPDQIAPYVGHLVGCFGPDRLMFGSDWPVCTPAASYGEVVALASDLLGRHLGSRELEAVFARNAVTAYGLRPPDG